LQAHDLPIVQGDPRGEAVLTARRSQPRKATAPQSVSAPPPAGGGARRCAPRRLAPPLSKPAPRRERDRRESKASIPSATPWPSFPSGPLSLGHWHACRTLNRPHRGLHPGRAAASAGPAHSVPGPADAAASLREPPVPGPWHGTGQHDPQASDRPCADSKPASGRWADARAGPGPAPPCKCPRPLGALRQAARPAARGVRRDRGFT
jgi:hypothetical protein